MIYSTAVGKMSELLFDADFIKKHRKRSQYFVYYETEPPTRLGENGISFDLKQWDGVSQLPYAVISFTVFSRNYVPSFSRPLRF